MRRPASAESVSLSAISCHVSIKGIPVELCGRAMLFLSDRCRLFAERGSCRFWQVSDGSLFLGGRGCLRDVALRCFLLSCGSHFSPPYRPPFWIHPCFGCHSIPEVKAIFDQKVIFDQ